MGRVVRGLIVMTLVGATPALAEVGVTLKGSPGSMVRQNAIAKDNDYSFLRTAAQIRSYVEAGRLVELKGNADYAVADFVRYPFARPEMEIFVERLASQYNEACGQKLVVTSLTRPINEQPRNSHALSVHPTGMAVDLRVPASSSCRSWLESALLSMENRGLLDATLERNPPHFHVALFPGPYMAFVESRLEAEAAEEAERLAAEAEERAAREALERLAAASGPLMAESEAKVAGDAERGSSRTRDWAALAAIPLAGGMLAVGAKRRSRKDEEA